MSPSLIPEGKERNDSIGSVQFLGGRMWAVGCALALLAAILVAHPYAEVGISDDFSYVRSAQVLAHTGHIVYNGGATAILGWQLYLAAMFIKLFGFSFTTTRASIMFISVVTAFLCQRTLVRAGLNERNAGIGTLTLMLSPLLMPLEVTFMTDVPGLFAVVVCLYCCLRAIQTDREWATIAWIGFASLSNVVFGSSRQIAWLGVLVMVPSAVWILRRSRRVVWAGIGFWVMSVLLIFAINHWFQAQPYMLHEPLSRGPVTPHVIKQLIAQMMRACFESVLVLLPVLLMFLPVIGRRRHPWPVYLMGVIFILYGLRMWHIHNLEALFAPYLGGFSTFGSLPILRPGLTIAVVLCILALLTAILTREKKSGHASTYVPASSDRMIAVLILPFTIAYIALISPRAGFESIWDRYLLPLVFVAVIFIVRFYQERFQARLPVAALILAMGFGAYATASLHDRLAIYRARAAAIHEVLAAGVPATSISGGWDDDGWTELEISGHIVDARMRVPPGVKLPKPTHYGLANCPWFYCDMFPHVVPYYTISLRPDPIPGRTFAPVPYRRWINSPGAVYVVRFPDRSIDGHVR